jgi:two-component system, OmpR family, alkaline phosphatase synthesis response regulator PhoP
MAMSDKRILIVDDEVHIRILMEQTLEELEDIGVELLLACDGAEALAMIREERPDLVFLDVMMPKMSGFEVCQAVKQDADLQDTYVVILTAKGQEIDIHQGGAVGADRYMTKPFDPDQILQVAIDVLQLAAVV